VLLPRDGTAWDGYVFMSEIRFDAGKDLKEAKRFMKEIAARTFRDGPQRLHGIGIPPATSIRELASWLGEMSAALNAAADAGGGPDAVAQQPVHVGALLQMLDALHEWHLADVVRAAHLRAAEQIIKQAWTERAHRDKPWQDWLVSGGINLGVSTDGPRTDFAVITARSQAEATGAVEAIFKDREVYRLSPLEQVRRIVGCSVLNALTAQLVPADQDLSKLPRLDLRMAWRWPWHVGDIAPRDVPIERE
jgi:hypothetical protein